MQTMTASLGVPLASRRARTLQRLSDLSTPYFFLLPGLALLATLMTFPIYKVVEYSLYNNVIVNPAPQFVGLDNYATLLADRGFWDALWNTAVFTVGSVVGHFIVGMALALLVNANIEPRVRLFFRAVLVLPWIFTAVVVALNWQLLLHPLGIINYGLSSLGLISEPLDWLGDADLAMWTLLVVSTWRGYPFLMVSFLSGLQSVPRELYEAADIDGASAFRKFWHVTLPQLKPVIYGVGLLDLIWTFQLFPLVWLLTAGGPGRETEVLSTLTYRLAFVEFQFAKASAVAVVVLLITALFAVLYLKQDRDHA